MAGPYYGDGSYGTGRFGASNVRILVAGAVGAASTTGRAALRKHMPVAGRMAAATGSQATATASLNVGARAAVSTQDSRASATRIIYTRATANAVTNSTLIGEASKVSGLAPINLVSLGRVISSDLWERIDDEVDTQWTQVGLH